MKLLSGYRVLIVEDDPTLCELLSEDFQLEGAQVESASSGNEALKLIHINQFDFILSDMRMTNGDGRFLAKEVSKMAAPRPIFFLYSGFNDTSVSESIELGIENIFTKPLVTSKLIESILSTIKHRKVS